MLEHINIKSQEKFMYLEFKLNKSVYVKKLINFIKYKISNIITKNVYFNINKNGPALFNFLLFFGFLFFLVFFYGFYFFWWGMKPVQNLYSGSATGSRGATLDP